MFLTLLCRPNLPSGEKNPMADVRVRQAMAMTVDKQFIVDNITRMGELPARTYLPPDGTLRDFTFRPGPENGGRTDNYSAAEVRAILASPGGLAGPGPGLQSTCPGPHVVRHEREEAPSAGRRRCSASETIRSQ